MRSILLNIPMSSLKAWVRFVVQNLPTRSQTEGVSHCCGSLRWEKRRWCEQCIWSKELTGNSAQQRWKILRYYLCEIFLWLWHLKIPPQCCPNTWGLLQHRENPLLVCYLAFYSSEMHGWESPAWTLVWRFFFFCLWLRNYKVRIWLTGCWTWQQKDCRVFS